MARSASRLNAIRSSQKKKQPEPSPRRSQRREARSAVSLRLTVCGLSSAGRLFFELASAVNLSSSGCCLRLHAQPERNSPLAVRLIPQGNLLSDETPQTLLQVAWMREDSGAWIVGAFALGPVDLRSLAFPERPR